MVYEDGHWSRDDLLRAEYKAGKLCGRYAAKAYGDDRLEKNARLTALKMASNAAKNNILSIAKSNPYIAVAQQAFDANPWLLNTPEGTVDLKTGEIRTHDSSDLLTKMTQVAPKPGEPTRFLSFLEEALQGDREYIRHVQKWLGYCLTGSTLEQKLAFFWGPGGNGKSVLLNTVQHIMGDYSRVTDTSTFAAQKNDQHPEALADLRGARLVAANETQEGRAWDEAKIKQATGGDKISARFLNRDRFEFTPTFKLLFVGNHKPKIANIDRAMRRRIHLMPFTVTPTVVDRNLEDKLKEEAGQILSWLIEGCLLWQKEGLEPPKIVQDATDDYFEDEDPIGRFLEERCVVKDGAAVLGSALFESWREWAEQQNESTRSLRWLVGQLTTRGGIGKWREPHTGRRGLRGLELIYNPGEFEAQPAPKTAKA
jgi:putative DNA primase/helicase